MAKTVADPRVLQATNQPNMLQNLQVNTKKGITELLSKQK